ILHPKSPDKRVKKTAVGLNVRRPPATNSVWERLSLPIEAVFGASAHPPQAPIWLYPSGCPPGRVSRFWRVFWARPHDKIGDHASARNLTASATRLCKPAA